MSFILEDHEETLRNLFTEFAKGDGTALYDELKSAKLLSYNEWKMLMRDLDMMNEIDFTVSRALGRGGAVGTGWKWLGVAGSGWE